MSVEQYIKCDIILTVWIFEPCSFVMACYCLLYTSDAADEEDSVDLGGRRIIKKKKKESRVSAQD